MTDNEIVQALERCLRGDCENCPIKKKCDSDTAKVIEETLDLIKRQQAEIERLKGELATDKNGGCKWSPASQPPKKYRDEYGELVPFLVCESGTEYPYRAMYDGKVWGDGFFVIPVTHWMPLPEPPKGE